LLYLQLVYLLWHWVFHLRTIESMIIVSNLDFGILASQIFLTKPHLSLELSLRHSSDSPFPLASAAQIGSVSYKMGSQMVQKPNSKDDS